MSELSQLMDIGMQACSLAQTEILKHYDQSVQVDWKPDHTPVTIADRNAEEKMREFLSQETPGFGVIGEEHGVSEQTAEYQWIIDPIDGTKSFIRGVPLFGTILGLWQRGTNLLGILNFPALQTHVRAGLHLGCWSQDRPCRVSSVASLKESTLVSGTVNTMEDQGYGEAFTQLRRASGLFRGWGDCYGYYLVATGRAEMMVDPIVSIWDIAALPVLLQEAGGHFSQLNGSTELMNDQGRPLALLEGYTGIATNGIVHQQALSFF